MKEEYEKFATGKDLPALEQLGSEFDVEDESPSVRDVLHSVRERLSFFSKIIEDILQPETSPATLQECRVFSESDKREIYRLYSEIMVLDRKLLYADVMRKGDLAADALRDVWSRIPKIKQEVGGIVEKMLDSWNLEHGDENYSEYFG